MREIEIGRCDDLSSIFRRISRAPGAFWLEGNTDALTSFMGCGPAARLSIDRDAHVKATEDARPGPGTNPEASPLQRIEEFVQAATAAALPAGAPRVVGYLAYDLGPLLEPAMGRREGHSPGRQGGERLSPCVAAPVASLARYDAVLVCTREYPSSGPAFRLSVAATTDSAARRLIRAATEPESSASGAPRTEPGSASRLAHAAPRHPPVQVLEAPDPEDYKEAVRRVQAYIAAGDVYQANLARAFVVEGGASPAELFLRLRAVQPVPFGAYLACEDLVVLSNSPERFLRVRGASIETEPIKGTRARSGDPVLDASRRDDLARDPKERAEHVMIVDLERNDLGRISAIGSVSVPSLMRVEEYATVHHLVSTVRGRLRDEVGLAEILRATFPGGSVTGAPKIRATQIIAELEPSSRGVYTGALVWFRGPRDFDSSIAIRTAVAQGGRLTYHVGAGIVADSDPEREYEECLLKARPFLEAAGVLG